MIPKSQRRSIFHENEAEKKEKLLFKAGEMLCTAETLRLPGLFMPKNSFSFYSSFQLLVLHFNDFLRAFSFHSLHVPVVVISRPAFLFDCSRNSDNLVFITADFTCINRNQWLWTEETPRMGTKNGNRET